MRTPWGPRTPLVCALLLACLPTALVRADGPPDGYVHVLARPWLAPELIGAGFGSAEAHALEASARVRLESLGARIIVGPEIAIITVEVALADGLVADLRATGEFRRVTPDKLLEPASTPDDPSFGLQWHLPAIHAPEAWDAWNGDPSGIVAVVDTGVDLAHPDLAPALLSGYNAVNRITQAAGGLVDDINGHGTAVAGAAAAVGNNGIGVSGIGWDLSILPVRVSNSPSGSAFLTDVVEGVSWSVQHGATVVNVSYEGVWEPIVQILGEWSSGLGTPLVWAAGNAGLNLNWFDHPDVIVVSGTTDTGVRWPSSSYGPAVDIASPAKYIYGPKKGGTYANRTGTSFAAAIISGTIALGQSARPDLPAMEIADALLSTAQDMGVPGEDDQFGHGLVDVAAFLGALDVLPPGDDGPTPDNGPPPSVLSSVILPPAAPPGHTAPGLRASYYAVPDLGAGTRLPNFGAMTPIASGLAPTVDLLVSGGSFGASGLADNVGAVLEGWVAIPARANYRLTLSSVDGSRLWVNGLLIIDHNGVHPLSAMSVNAWMSPGLYPIRVESFCVSGSPRLQLRVTHAGVEEILPPEWCAFEPAPADYNADGIVDILDLLDFIADFGVEDPRADVNGDTVVDVLDFLDFFDWFGQ